MNNIESARKAITKKSKQAAKTTMSVFEVIDFIKRMGPDDCKLVRGVLDYKDSCFRQSSQGACSTTTLSTYQQAAPIHAFPLGDPDTYDPLKHESLLENPFN